MKSCGFLAGCGFVVLWVLAPGWADEPEWVPVFTGTDLSGWVVPEGNEAKQWYRAVDGVLQIQSDPEQKGSILWSEKSWRDFLFSCEFRFGEGIIDSGIHVRNQDQIQIGISGSLKRDMTGSPFIPGKGYPVEAQGVADLLRMTDWNELKVQVIGPRYTVWLNGVRVLDYESETAIAEGPVGIQLHGSRDMSISFRNLKAAEL